jgi:hypothetical protein
MYVVGDGRWWPMQKSRGEQSISPHDAAIG